MRTGRRRISVEAKLWFAVMFALLFVLGAMIAAGL
jgi:hypothetical protein